MRGNLCSSKPNHSIKNACTCGNTSVVPAGKARRVPKFSRTARGKASPLWLQPKLQAYGKHHWYLVADSKSAVLHATATGLKARHLKKTPAVHFSSGHKRQTAKLWPNP